MYVIIKFMCMFKCFKIKKYKMEGGKKYEIRILCR